MNFLLYKMTSFQKVLEFNKAFGITTHNTPQKDIFDTDPKLVKYRLSLITEEVSELIQAIEEKNFVEVIDALMDIIYVVEGAAASFGVDSDKAFDIVHKSNMSKLCISDEEAQMTVDWYKLNESNRYDTPSYRDSDDKVHKVVYNKSTMKILKSINYKPADFRSLL